MLYWLKGVKRTLRRLKMIQVKVIGQMDKDNENSFESTNRVYSTKGLSPTLNTCGGVVENQSF